MTRHLAFLLLSATFAAPLTAFAQARAGDDAAAASPLAPLFAQFDEALAPRLIGADDAASRWISGRLATLEPAEQARDYAAAAAREPKEMLYAASLAEACVRTPAAADCSDRDAVGYWVSRDAENAVPWLLQAERARRRNNTASMIDNLERASRANRYDSYDHRAGAVLYAKLKPVTPAENRAAAILYAVGQAPGGASLQAIETLCAPQARALDARIAPACHRLGNMMAERAAMLSDQRAGTQLALAAAPSDGARSTASEQARAVVARQDQCREVLQGLERAAFGSPDQRNRAAAIGEQFVVARARDGEIVACEALGRSLAIRN